MSLLGSGVNNSIPPETIQDLTEEYEKSMSSSGSTAGGGKEKTQVAEEFTLETSDNSGTSVVDDLESASEAAI